MPFQRSRADGAQTRGAILYDASIDLRHARGGRAGARAKGEGVDEGEGAFVDQRQRVGEVLFGFSRETGDEIGAERDFGTRGLEALTQIDRLCARVAALHALEDEIVAVLQRKMQMGRDAI